MKRLLPIFVLFLMAICANAKEKADFTVDGIGYKLSTYGTMVVSVDNKAKKVEIPELVTYKNTTYLVTSIGEAAFQKNSTVETVVLPTSITSIGEIAFGACTKLKSINIPGSVTEIGTAAFYGCSSLQSIKIPDGIKQVAGSLFWGCARLTDVTLPNSVTSIGEEAFRECLTLASFTIPKKVNKIDKNAFQKCQKLTNVYCYAESVPNADKTAFEGSPIESATLYVPSKSVNSYKGASPWKKFKNIVALGTTPDEGDQPDTPEQQEKAGKPDFTVDGIGYMLSTYGTMVVSVDNKAKKVEIPELVTYNNTTYLVTSIGEAAFQKNSTVETVVLPTSITSIGEIAFGACTKLKSINIPSSVTSIGTAAFYNCSSLQSIKIPDGIKKIANCLFWGCARLTDVTLPNSVTTIGEEAFRECLTLATFTIPKNVNKIDKNAFQKCQKLLEVYCYAESVPTTDGTAFSGSPIESATLYVPSKAVKSYKGASPWKKFKNIVAIGSTPGEEEKPDTPEKDDKADFTVDGIGYKLSTYGVMVVSVDKKKKEVEIPELVTYKNTTYLVTSIGEAAFQNNSTVENVVLPTSITSIGEIAFGACTKLKSIDIPNSVTEIGTAAFYGCSSLQSINIPDGVKSIAGSTFWGCSRLTDVTIPTSVTSIGEEAFRECLTLASIAIPSYVTEIGKNAFQKCQKLKNVYCYAEVLPITDSTVFDGSPIESATLHVLDNLVEVYKASWPWRGFKEIVGLTNQDFDGIEGVKLSEDGKGVYYDLTGRKVSHLQKGVYIKNGKKILISSRRF